MVSCVYNLWPNDYYQTLDIFLIHNYNRALPIVHWSFQSFYLHWSLLTCTGSLMGPCVHGVLIGPCFHWFFLIYLLQLIRALVNWFLFALIPFLPLRPFSGYVLLQPWPVLRPAPPLHLHHLTRTSRHFTLLHRTTFNWPLNFTTALVTAAPCCLEDTKRGCQRLDLKK